jgi:hypothetical protein
MPGSFFGDARSELEFDANHWLRKLGSLISSVGTSSLLFWGNKYYLDSLTDENDCDFSCPDGFTDPVEFATDVLMAKAAKDTLIAFIDEVIHSIELDDMTNDRIDWIKERCGIIDMSVTETTDNSKTTTYTIKICF